jgi:molybdopterin-guanine dinucleotide biosynthesis protein A
VVARARPLASEVIVSTSSVRRQAFLAPRLPSGTAFLVDRPGGWGPGPVGAMARGLEALGDGPVLFTPGDTPWIETGALRTFVELAQASRVDVAAPYWASGETEHLLQWHRSRETLRHLPPLGESLRPSWRASEFLRAAPRTLLVPVSALSRRPRSFAHLTYRSDLSRPSARGTPGARVRPLRISGYPKQRYLEAQAHRRAGRRQESAKAFGQEARWYATAGLRLLARHAFEDAVEALGTVNP